MSKLREEQSKFTKDICEFTLWLYEQGYEVTDGEARRTAEQQAIYVKNGRSKTFDSYHLKSLARDLNIFKDGRLLTTKEELLFAGNKWESMCAANSWGGNWKSFKDIPHFERRFKG